MAANGHDGSSSSSGDQLLDSWKEISVYLGRAVRTVQTWEKDEAIATGRIKKIDSIYILEIDVTEAATGVMATSLREEVDSRSALLSAAYELSIRARRSLGEMPLDRPNEMEALHRVSTRSLEALRLYSRADELMRAENLGAPPKNGTAEALLREAIAQDPAFASAHLMLGWAVLRQGRPTEEAMPHMERALDLADSASEVEAFFIRGSHALLQGDQEMAVAQYQALVARDPGHFWAPNNLSGLLRNIGRPRDALAVTRARAIARPNNFGVHYLLALNSMLVEGFEAAKPHIEHTLTLPPPDERAPYGDAHSRAFLEGALKWEPWLYGELVPLVAEVERLEEEISATPGGEYRQSLIWLVGSMENGLGRLDRHAYWVSLTSSDRSRHRGELLNLYLREDTAGMAKWLERYVARVVDREFVDDLFADLLAQTGRADLAERIVERNRLNVPALVRGHIALARGDLEAGIAGLEEGLTLLIGRNSRYFLAVEALAGAYRAKGNEGKARVLLEEASGYRSHTISSFSGIFWLRHQIAVADHYRALGIDDLARDVESEVLALLAFADADHPLRVKLLARLDSHL